MASEVRLDTFLALSKALTGVAELDPALAPGLFARLTMAPEAAELDELLTTYSKFEGTANENERIAQEIMGVDHFKSIAVMIVVLWYTGDLVSKMNEPPPVAEAEYFGGALWRIARAHPPALSGGYFGHWAYPPDNPYPRGTT